MKLLSLASLVVLLLQVPLSSLQQQRALGSIEGLVTRAGSSQPVPSARVTLSRRGGPSAPGALPAPTGGRGGPAALPPIPPLMTDDKGRFAFHGLEEGTYTLQIQANGYVIQPYGQRFPNGPGTPIPLSAGQVMKDVIVSLTPAANISGRIRDTAEQPLINVPIQLLRYSYDGTGQRRYQPVGATLTNDRGEYRMYWVTPGRYYMLAGVSPSGGNPLESVMLMSLGGTQPNGNDVPPVPSYAFYPGVTEIGNARAIDLQPGADVQAIDLVLATKPRTFSIRGKLIDSRTGQPPARASVSAVPQTPGLSGSSQIIMGPSGFTRNYNAATGAIEIRDLLPGTYTVIAMVQDPRVAGRGGPVGQSIGMLPVAISASDVDGITVSVVPSISVPGRLRVEGQLPQGLTIDRLRFRLVPLGATAALQQMLQGQVPSSPMASAGVDGTFRLNNILPGEYRVDVLGLPTAPGNAAAATSAILKEVRFEGVDVLNSPLRFSGSTNNGLDIVIAVGGGRITGAVTDPRSQLVPSIRVVLVPDRSRYRSDLHKTATTDQNGQFVLSGISPGDYKVFAWEFLEDFAWFDPEVLSRFETRGRAVHVTETSNEAIDVRLIPAEGGR